MNANPNTKFILQFVKYAERIEFQSSAGRHFECLPLRLRKKNIEIETYWINAIALKPKKFEGVVKRTRKDRTVHIVALRRRFYRI